MSKGDQDLVRNAVVTFTSRSMNQRCDQDPTVCRSGRRRSRPPVDERFHHRKGSTGGGSSGRPPGFAQSRPEASARTAKVPVRWAMRSEGDERRQLPNLPWQLRSLPAHHTCKEQPKRAPDLHRSHCASLSQPVVSLNVRLARLALSPAITMKHNRNSLCFARLYNGLTGMSGVSPDAPVRDSRHRVRR